MYVIIAYDVVQERVARVCKFLRRYLTWVQNSVFEGELTEGKLKEIKLGLRDHINEDEDSILFYRLSNQKWVKKEVMGIEKNPTDTFV